jgi:hypothetical protein
LRSWDAASLGRPLLVPLCHATSRSTQTLWRPRSFWWAYGGRAAGLPTSPDAPQGETAPPPAALWTPRSHRTPLGWIGWWRLSRRGAVPPSGGACWRDPSNPCQPCCPAVRDARCVLFSGVLLSRVELTHTSCAVDPDGVGVAGGISLACVPAELGALLSGAFVEVDRAASSAPFAVRRRSAMLPGTRANAPALSES